MMLMIRRKASTLVLNCSFSIVFFDLIKSYPQYTFGVM